MKFKRVHTVAAQRFEIEIGKEYFLRVDSGERLVRIPAELKDGKETRPASEVNAVMVTDMLSGETGEMMLNHVMQTALQDNYPDGYKDKIFRVVKGEKQRGKDYYPMQIDEVEITE